MEKWFSSPLRGRRSPTPSRDFHFLVEFDLPLSLEGSSKNHSFSASPSLGCVRETSSHRTCLTAGIAVPCSSREVCAFHSGIHQLFFCLKRRFLIFPQLQNTCLPSEDLLLGYFGPFRKIDPVTLIVWSIFLTK